MQSSRIRIAVLAGLLSACSDGSDSDGSSGGAGSGTAPEFLAGQRLFREPRFAQYFQANAFGALNTPLAAGDPALDTIELDGLALAGPFAGATFSCATCHMVDEALGLAGGGVRSHADFAPRTPLTEREDGASATVRNTQALANAAVEHAGPHAFHFDGEFATQAELAREKLVGRSFGWLPSERAQAVAHLADVVRRDDGSSELALEFGGLSYAELFLGTDVPDEYQLPAALRLDVLSASDEEVLAAVATLIAAYTEELAFARDANGEYSASPYDRFLENNDLPRKPDPGEDGLSYARRLRAELELLQMPVWVKVPEDQGFASHDQTFIFTSRELAGLRIFLSEPAGALPTAAELSAGKIGNCVACHVPPDFSDFLFHGSGVSQAEYDGLHGQGAFVALEVPDLAERSADPELYLPASANLPGGLGPFRAQPSLSDPALADLGLWNSFANEALPGQQADLRALVELVEGPGSELLSDAELLPETEAAFRTPSLRDLGHSDPYGHHGGFANLDDVFAHYLTFSALARAGQVRNADPRLAGIALQPGDLEVLDAFLRSLNEDYE